MSWRHLPTCWTVRHGLDLTSCCDRGMGSMCVYMRVVNKLAVEVVEFFDMSMSVDSILRSDVGSTVFMSYVIAKQSQIEAISGFDNEGGTPFQGMKKEI